MFWNKHKNQENLLMETLSVTMSKHEKLRLFHTTFIFLNIILICSLLILGQVGSNMEKRILHDKIREETDSIKNVISMNLRSILADMFFTRELLNTIFNEKDRSTLEREETIVKTLTSFINYKFEYDHIRLLNTTGQETIRINRDYFGRSTKVPEDKLQDKSTREYFKESLVLNDNMAYISQFDFNKEYGVYELPYKSILRVAIPIYTGENLSNILISNFLGNEIIDDIITLLKQRPRGKTDKYFILNGSGEALGYFSFDKEREPEYVTDPQAAFIFTDETGLTGKDIINQPDDILYIDNKLVAISTLNSEKIILLSNDDTEYQIHHTQTMQRSQRHENDIIIVIVLGVTSYTDQLITLFLSNLDAIFVTELVFMIIAFLYANTLYKQRLLENEIKAAAAFDPLTSLYNRRFGILFLKYEIKKLKRTREPVSLIVVDVDNLKKVNDLCGHSAGDELICTVAKELKKNVRDYDIVCRTGGDEFFIAFSGANINTSLKIIGRVRQHLLEKYKDKFNNIGISFSFGGVDYSSDNYDTIDEFLADADAKMYEDKKSRRIFR